MNAQEEDDPFAGIEEMVVVGTGAASLFQNQEVSAIAFDAEYLEAIGANDLTDVAQFTPNLEIRTPFAASNPTLFIRGVGLRDFNANSSASVAVYNDEIYMNSPAGQLSQLFDVLNIDVLRGPQGTIYGRNASAGTIRVISKKPTGTPGASFTTTYGRFNQVDFEAAVENVVVPDMISMRTSGKWSQRDGTTHNRCADPRYTSPPPSAAEARLSTRDFFTRRVNLQCFNPANTEQFSTTGNNWIDGQPAPVKEWVNDRKNWAGRTIVRFQHPVADMDWQLNIHGGQNRGDARQFQMVGARQLPVQIEPEIGPPSDANNYLDYDNYQRIPETVSPGLPGTGRARAIQDPFIGNPYEGDYNNVEKELLDLFGASLVGEMTFGEYKLTTITGYEWNQRDTELNLDGNPFQGLEPRLSNEAYQVTQELRLDWDDGGGFAWQLGGMYLYESLDVDNVFQININLPENTQKYTFFTRYASGWASFNWDPAETFTVKGGLRVNYEDKELNLETAQFDVNRVTGDRTLVLLPGVPVDQQNNPAYANAATSEMGIAGDVIATWSPAEDVSFYLRYARGWKGPHINGGVVNPGAPDSERSTLVSPVEPEKIDSVEMGMKSRFWSDRITMNWALFYYDYQDIQVFQLKNAGGTVPVQELINADDADILGFEWEFDIKPFEGWAHPVTEGLWIHLTFAWLDSKYTDFVNTNDVVSPSGARVTITEDFSGNRLVNSPEYSFIGFVAWPIGGEWGTLIPRFDWSFKDTVYFSPANSDLISQDPLWIMNMRLTYKAPSQNMEVSGWVSNLTDQAYTVDVFNLARLRSSILHAVGDPRTYGITLKVTF